VLMKDDQHVEIIYTRYRNLYKNMSQDDQHIEIYTADNAGSFLVNPQFFR